MGDDIAASSASEVMEIINEVDLTAVLDKLQQLIDVNTSIYHFVAYFVIIFFAAVVVYMLLRPLLCFFR